MEYCRREVTFTSQNPRVYLACFSDLHVGEGGFARRHFRNWLKRQMEREQCWFINLGDKIEAIGPKDKRFTIGHIDPRYLEAYNRGAIINMQINDLCEMLEPVAPRILGLGRGNHEMKLFDNSGFDPHMSICTRLGVPDIGYSFLMSLILRREGAHESRILRIYGHHGWGGGTRTLGGDKTKVAGKLGEYLADIYLFGHSHQAWDEPKPRITVTRTGTVQVLPMILANTGTFKKSLSAGPLPTWGEMMGFPPQDLGGRVIEITMNTNHNHKESPESSATKYPYKLRVVE